MAIYKVKKRNGSIVTFDKSKIANAIKQAIKASWWSDFENVDYLTNLVIQDVETKVWNDIPNIEDIQDAVEQTLIKQWHDEVAKSYIVYRKKEKNQEKVEMLL